MSSLVLHMNSVKGTVCDGRRLLCTGSVLLFSQLQGRKPTTILQKKSPDITIAQLGIGIGAKGLAEFTKRGDKFSEELDFVLANVIMALVADFCLVWLPAPTLSFK